VATPSFSHKHADACFSVRGVHQGCIHSAGTVISIFLFFFARDSPFACKRKFGVIYLLTLGNGLHLLAFLLYQGRHALSFSSFHAYEIFVRDRGIFAHMICFSCWKWTSNRLEAEGNVQIIRAGKHIGMGQAGMAVGVAVGALHGKASYS
jgi:hypothetical protein